ncbi:zinc finger and BTB domain-containing protein 11-like isoform X1 [Gigantopelta aegis]|uniref:zinc finger and BTB domain-containing protein 11-like isoform X1 n=1 Tax=Gigantopelta aegis TaxID=1735272 RepID=UPI001B887D36|nr:zinc finger and BTB domain-containing protein 11-like isoform X1 [Gigantopelta aegis]
MDKQYSVQFFTSLVESIQKCCRDFLDFDQAVELSGYLNLEIDNFKKERYVLSEMISNTGDVISESYCTKAFKTVQRNPRRSPPPSPPRANSVLKDSSNHLDRNRAGGVGERGSPAPQAGKRHFGLSQRHHYLSPFHPGRRRNLIQSRRSVPSSFTQSSSFTRSSPSQSKDSQPYDIQARTSMAMTFSPSTEVVASLSQSFSVFGNDSLPSGAVKSDVSGLDDSDRSKEKTSGDLEALYVAATSVSDLEQSVFPSVSSNIYTSVTQTSAESVNTGTALETAASYTESAGSYAETVRLPVRIKEEEEENDDDDIMFIEGPTDISGTGGSTVNTSDSNVDISHPGMQSRLSSSLSDAQQHVGEDRSGGEDMKKSHTVYGPMHKEDGVQDTWWPPADYDAFMTHERAADGRTDLTSVTECRTTGYSSQPGASVHTASVGEQSNILFPRYHRQTLLGSQSSPVKTSSFVSQSGTVKLDSGSDRGRFGSLPGIDVQSGGSSGGLRYSCNQCSYHTLYRHNLRRHKRIHSGDFFHCHLCTCHFSDSYRLKQHLKVHADKLPCQICGKLFFTHDGLARHTKTHLA